MMADTSTPRARDGSYLKMLISAWTYSQNFLIKDRRTGVTPVEAHLGLWRASNITSWNQCIEEAPPLEKEYTLGKMQSMLQMAYNRKKMNNNINKGANKEKRKQLKDRVQLKKNNHSFIHPKFVNLLAVTYFVLIDIVHLCLYDLSLVHKLS